jgi:predicted AAA+ superfamily ATPase
LFTEYTEYLGLEKNKTSYLAYLQSGGLPELFHLSEEETKRHYIASLKDTILFKDIVQRYQIKDAALLEKVFVFLADNIGGLFSLNAIVHYLTSHRHKTNHETISNYVNYLRQSYLIHEVERFDVKGKSILAGNKKYYLNDLAFRTYLSSSFDAGLGRALENSIYLYYRAQGYKIFVGTLGKQEVDFVIEKGKEKKYIQAAYSLTGPKVLERELAGLTGIRDHYEKWVLTLDDLSFGSKEGIRHGLAWEWV